MKKIMFNDKYGLTKAVLEGHKTMTRRIVSEKLLERAHDYMNSVHGTGFDMHEYLFHHSPYKALEVVAVAQAYEDVYDEMSCNGTDSLENARPILAHSEDGGWDNKMFVSAELMPHQIRITAVHIERLQNISDDDCLREGVKKGGAYAYYVHGEYDILGLSAKGVFSILIDKVSGKGTWESNPWVFVYEFELVK